MSKRYRLKKDLPDVETGTLGSVNDSGLLCLRSKSEAVTMPRYVFENPEKYPDWFEEIPENIEDAIAQYIGNYRDDITMTDHRMAHDIIKKIKENFINIV